MRNIRVLQKVHVYFHIYVGNEKMNCLKKYKDVILYLFFGVLTTVINIVSYWLMAHPLGFGVMPSTKTAWIVSVLFAYITNRIWVFQSTAKAAVEIAKEILSFVGCRLATGVLDWVCMFVFVDILHINDIVIKCASNVLVIVLNYVASKLLIFRKRDT